MDAGKLTQQANETQTAIDQGKQNISDTQQSLSQTTTNKANVDKDVANKTTNATTANNAVSQAQNNVNSATTAQNNAQTTLNQRQQAVADLQSQLAAMPTFKVDKAAWEKAVNGLVSSDELVAMTDAEYAAYKQKWYAYCQQFFETTASNNQFTASAQDNNTTFTNINQLSESQYEYLTNYALNIINQARNIWRGDNNEMSAQVIDLKAAAEIAQAYSDANVNIAETPTHLSSVVTATANKYHVGVGTQTWMDEQLGETFINHVIKVNGKISLAEIKQQLFEDLQLMLFGDGGQNSWGHFYSLMGGASTDSTYNNHYYVGIAFDKFGHLHLTGRSTANIGGTTPDTTPIASAPTVTQLKQSLATAQNAQNTAQINLNNAKASLTTANATLATARQDATNAQSALNAAKTKQTQLANQVTALNNKLTSLKTKLANDTTSLAKIKSELANLADAQAAQQKVLDNAKARVQATSATLATATANANAKTAALKSANQTLSAAQQVQAIAEGNAQSAANTAKEAVVKAQNAVEVLTNANQHVVDAKAQLAAITDKLNNFASLKQHSLNELTSAQELLSTAKTQLKQANDVLNTQQQKLDVTNHSLDAAKLALDKATQFVNQRQTEYDAAKAYLSKLDHADETLAAAKAALEAAKVQLATSQTNYQTAKENAADAQQELTDAQTAAADADQAYTHAEKVLQTLKLQASLEVPTVTEKPKQSVDTVTEAVVDEAQADSVSDTPSAIDQTGVTIATANVAATGPNTANTENVAPSLTRLTPHTPVHSTTAGTLPQTGEASENHLAVLGLTLLSLLLSGLTLGRVTSKRRTH
ncbi:SEC10/PgrA surface exclusion domain-containing protein [Lactiplantibacillus pentosus]|uniref:SEC10/PgrA surface exclusion domain-containing protein n=1 Tax=Lactiplantibacillus pentosus TaxID=1589 RepID=UPI001C1F2A6E|nr:SEC10/PgrA surface exclusion domain-containing protein [Lactiplantibacillus pentosus]MBU7503686.1 SEC10/PgrA surface exclusion domain-containing protein [Lactiplantibacillus pentosus]MDY1545254.1 SEC10/PgrA surface exclusion domain-containing protein [Lactiplantibacillus pentosus]